MKINWLKFLFRRNLYDLWSLKIFSFCAVWKINNWELKTLSLHPSFCDYSKDGWDQQYLFRKPTRLIKFLIQYFSVTYRIGSFFLITQSYNVKKEARRKYVVCSTSSSFSAKCPTETIIVNKSFPA